MMACAASVMLLACVVLASCKNGKGRTNSDMDEDDEDETELAEATTEDDEEATAASGAQQNVVDVRTARELLLALKSDTHIRVVTIQQLNLTDALDDLIDEGVMARYYVNERPRQDAGVFWDPVYDGNSLIVSGLNNITIEALSDEKGSLLVTPSYADVLRFVNCENIVLKNLIMGHKVTGYCVGDVLVLNECKNVSVSGCELFGCGVNGLHVDHSTQVAVTGTEMYGCSFMGVVLEGARNVSFDKCKVFNNGGGIYVDEHCSRISFDKSKFFGNKGMLFSCNSAITVKNSDIEHHYDKSTANVSFTNCQVEMDYDEAEDIPDYED